MIKKLFKKFNFNNCENKDEKLVSDLIQEGNKHLCELKKIDQEIMAVQKSTRTSFSFFATSHNYLRTRYVWYYDWHVKPYTNKIHIWSFFLITLIFFFSARIGIIGNKTAISYAAGNSCVSNNSGSWSDPATWSSCEGGIPELNDSVEILSGHTVELSTNIEIDSTETENNTVLTINGNGILETNDFNLIIGDLNNYGTFNAGGSDITVLGNWNMAGNFITNDSSVIMSGTDTQTLNSGNKAFDNLIHFSPEATLKVVQNDLTINKKFHNMSGDFDNRDEELSLVFNGEWINDATFYTGNSMLTYSNSWTNNYIYDDVSGMTFFSGVITLSNNSTEMGTFKTKELYINESASVTLGSDIVFEGNYFAVGGALSLGENHNLTINPTSYHDNSIDTILTPYGFDFYDESSTFDGGSGSSTLVLKMINDQTVYFNPGNNPDKFRLNNLTVDGEAGTLQLISNDLIIDGDLNIAGNSILNTLDTNVSPNISRAIVVSGSLFITTGKVIANASTITVEKNWTNSVGFTCNTSTVSLTGTGKFTPASGTSFYNLNLASNDNKTTFENNRYISIENVLTLGSGTLKGQLSGGFNLKKPNAAPFINNNATITGGTNFRYTGENQTIASATYPTLFIWGTGTAILNGDITSNSLGIYASGGGLATLDSNNYNITANNIGLGVSGTTAKNGKLKLGNGSLTTTGNLTVHPQSVSNHNTLDLGTGTHYIGGNFINNDTLIAGTSTIDFNKASGTQTLDSGGIESIKAFNNLTHSGAGTLQLANNDIKITGNFLNSSGTFTTLDSTDNTTSRNVLVSGNFAINSSSTVYANASTISVGGNWGNSGSFQTGTSTVNLLGTGSFSGGFYNLIAAADGHKVNAGVVVISNTLTLGSGTYQANNTYLGSSETPLITAGATLLGSMIYGSSKPGQINVAATNYSTLRITGTNNTFVAAGDISAQDFGMNYQDTNNRSTFDTAGYNFTINNDITIGGSGANRKSTFRPTGSGLITVGRNITNNSGETSGQNIIDLSNYSGTMSVGGNFINNDTLIAGTSTIDFNKASGTQTLDSGGIESIKAFNNLTHSGAGTLQLANNDIKITGNFLNSSGVFDAADLNLSVAKDFNISGGSFKTQASGNPTTQTVFLRSMEKTILSGSNTFNNLTIDTIADGPKTVNFASGSTQIITGNLTLSGSEDKVLTLNREGGSNDDTWELTLSDNYTSGDFINVSNSLITAPYKIKPGANVVDGGNNIGWIFNNTPNIPTLNIPLAGAWINSHTPDFTFSLSDPDNPGKDQKLRYQIQVSSHSDFSNMIVDFTSALDNEGNFTFKIGQAPNNGSYNEDCGEENQTLPQGQYYWRVKAIDDKDDSSDYSPARIFNIDMNIPSISFITDPADPNGNSDWYKTLSTVTISASSPLSPIKNIYYKWGLSDDFSLYTTALSIPEGVHTLYAYAVNEAGNSGQSSPVSSEFKVDTYKPLVDIYADPPAPSGNISWYKGSSPAITFTAFDQISGAESIFYRWNDEQYVKYDSPIIALEGIHTISYYSVDVAGNQSPVFDREYKVDISLPTVTLSNSILPGTSIGWYKDSPPTISLSSTDTHSGVASIRYRFGTTGDFFEYTSPITANEGVSTLYYYALDNAGNPSDIASTTYQLDSSPPDISNLTPLTTTPINKIEVPFVWNEAADNNGSGIDHYLVCLSSSSNFCNLTEETVAFENNFRFVFPDDGTYFIRIRAVDRVGHVSNYSNESKVVIDRVSPILTISGLTDDQYVTTKDINLTGTTTKPITGIAKVRVTIDDNNLLDAETSDNWNSWTFSWKDYSDGIHTLLIEAVGNAGNITSTKFTVMVDTLSPTVPKDFRLFNASNSNAQAYAAYLDFAESTDETSKIKVYEVYRNEEKIDKIEITKDADNLNFTGNLNQPYFFIDPNISAQKYSYKIRSIDNAGNTSETEELVIDTAGKTIQTDSITELKANSSSIISKEKTSAIITWKTLYPATSLVEYGTTTNYENKTEIDNNLNQGHSVLLKDLKPGTVYHMKVTSRDIYGRNLESNDTTFTTEIAPEELSAVQLIIQTLQNLFKLLVSGKTIAADNNSIDKKLDSLQGFSNNLLLTDISFKEKNLYQNILTFPKGSKITKGTTLENLSAIDDKNNFLILDQNLSPDTTYLYSLDSGIPIIRKPVVGDDSPLKITDNIIIEESVITAKDKVQLTVQWKTNRGAGSSVEFGSTSAYGQKTKDDNSLNMGHNVTLENLSPNTTYHFKVSSKDAMDNMAVSDDFIYTTPSTEANKTALDIIIESLKRVLSLLNILKI